MLTRDPQMTDIDVDQWRNLQELLLDSAKAKRRIVVIHEDGQVLKQRHSAGEDISGAVSRVDDPGTVAAELHMANQSTTDLVLVLDRRAVERYLAEVQGSWSIDDTIDEFARRWVTALDDHPTGIVTHPGPAATQLGLQWRLGASYAEVETAQQRFAPAGGLALFGLRDGGRLWTSLVLGFDDERRMVFISTADGDLLEREGTTQELATGLGEWARHKLDRPSDLTVVLERADAERMLKRPGKLTVLAQLRASGAAALPELPVELAAAIDAEDA